MSSQPEVHFELNRRGTSIAVHGNSFAAHGLIFVGRVFSRDIKLVKFRGFNP